MLEFTHPAVVIEWVSRRADISPNGQPGVAMPSQPCIDDLPAELLRLVFAAVDTETLATSVPLVCKTWRHISCQPATWHGIMSPPLVACLDDLAKRGPRISPAQLYLALYGRNFLRNPDFRRDSNSSLLTPLLRGPPGSGGWAKWYKSQGTAWVLNTAVGAKDVAWETSPQGMAPEGCSADPSWPPSPLPYPGTRHVVASYMQKALRGFLNYMRQATEEAGEPGAGGASGDLGPAAAQWQPARAPGWRPQSLTRADQAGVSGGMAAATPCLASLENWSEVTQVVDLDWELQRRGLTAAQAAHLLDSELSLRFSVYVGSRHDSEGEYAAALLLDEGRPNKGGAAPGDASGGDAVPSLQSFVMRRTRHLGYREVEHMPRGEWQRFEYVVPVCPRGFRRAVVMLRGRRAPGSEAGQGQGVAAPTKYCGAKFASAELVFA